MPELEYGTQKISYGLSFIERKSMSIEVHPDLTVHVIAPNGTELDSIELKLLKRAKWILKQQQYFTQFLPRTPEKEYVSGETHLYLGRRYQLKVSKSETESVKLKGGKLLVQQRDPNNSGKTQNLLTKWYFKHAERMFLKLHEDVSERFSKLIDAPPTLEIRRMKNRWGSCTPKGRIILNPELIKAHTNSIRYVMVHEMCHLIEPNHNKAFFELQSKMMPEWKYRKDRLESVMA